MKLPHAAALALVGWYLMAPPQQWTQAMQRYSAYMNSHRAAPMGTATPVGEDKVSKREVLGATISAWGKWGPPPTAVISSVPPPPGYPTRRLYRWYVYSAYDSARDCERAKRVLPAELAKWAQCIATDDLFLVWRRSNTVKVNAKTHWGCETTLT